VSKGANVKQLPGRFWIELGIAIASLALLVVTVLWRDWIELAFGFDPDSYSGSLEWLIVAASCAVAIAFFVLARAEWRKALAATA
jgi:hypothetical protein